LKSLSSSRISNIKVIHLVGVVILNVLL